MDLPSRFGPTKSRVSLSEQAFFTPNDQIHHIQPQEMFTRWHSMKQASTRIPYHSTTQNGASTPLYPEPGQADVGGAQDDANMPQDMDLAKQGDEHANRTPQYDPPTLGPGQRGFAYWKSTAFVSAHGAVEWEEAPLAPSSCSAGANNRKNCNPSVPIQEGAERTQRQDAKLVYIGKRVKNIILFGETGVGKSSVINLMAGRDIAKTSGNLQGCTLQSTEYWFNLSEELSLRIFDTVGLEEPEMGINSFMGAIEKAHQLVNTLHYSGGIDLLLFCIRAGRITAGMQRSYRLFYEVLCGGQVPLAIIVTNLEQEEVMEDWWVKNGKTFQEYGIRPFAHACITTIPARVTLYAQKRAESQAVLRSMLYHTLTRSGPAYVRDIRGWFTTILQLLRSYLAKTESPKKKDLTKRLERRCMLPRHDAEKLAQILVGDGTANAALV